MLTYFANPARFRALASFLLPLFWLLTLILWPLGLYHALVLSPPDYQQGETVRIMYIHVPAAWMGVGIYVAMGVAALMGFVWKHRMAHLFCRAAAPVGMVMTLLCLATGSLWGQPMWGTWWVWDARLTSVLLLFFLYLGYLALVGAFANEARGEKAGALLLLAGCINVPIIRFSVDWWQTLHQPASLLRAGGNALHPEMLTPLLLMGGAFAVLCGGLIVTRLLQEMTAQQIAARAQKAAAPARSHVTTPSETPPTRP